MWQRGRHIMSVFSAWARELPQSSLKLFFTTLSKSHESNGTRDGVLLSEGSPMASIDKYETISELRRGGWFMDYAQYFILTFNNSMPSDRALSEAQG